MLNFTRFLLSTSMVVSIDSLKWSPFCCLNNFEGLILGRNDKMFSGRVENRSQLDDICLVVHCKGDRVARGVKRGEGLRNADLRHARLFPPRTRGKRGFDLKL